MPAPLFDQRPIPLAAVPRSDRLSSEHGGVRALKGYAAASVLIVLARMTDVAEDDELQKKLANPISDLITIPFQHTTTLRAGPLDKPQHTSTSSL